MLTHTHTDTPANAPTHTTHKHTTIIGQRYWLGKWFIGKYKLPKDFISCQAPLLKVPPNDIATKYTFAIQPGTGDRKELPPAHVKRNAFMLCHFIPALNEAARFFKTHHCTNDPPNMKKEFIFHKDLEIDGS